MHSNRIIIIQKDKSKQFLDDSKKNVITPEFLKKCLHFYKLLNKKNDAINEFNKRYLALGLVPTNQIISEKVIELISEEDPIIQTDMGYELFGDIYQSLTMDDIDDLINLV